MTGSSPPGNCLLCQYYDTLEKNDLLVKMVPEMIKPYFHTSHVSLVTN